ncbi:SDR family oxidoreductase [Longimicrobium terrae]|nr:SDR family oxidoreductase [Longimicrobium terrae]
MRVAVFGATGKIGQHVVNQLLAAGHSVTAYVRNAAKLTTVHPDLNIVEGELDQPPAITRALEGADAVISALGPALRRGAAGTPVTNGTRNIVDAMRAAGVHRYIGLATPAVADPRDRPTLQAKLFRLMPRLAFPNALVEIDGMTRAVTSSDLDWTIARIISPNDRPATGVIRSGFLGRDKVGTAMSRADIAAFLVSQLTTERYRRMAPVISN